MIIEIKDTSDTQIYHSGENVGERNGVNTWELIIDGEVRGRIYSSSPKVYQVCANSYKHGLGGKFFKTFAGAKKWLINREKKYKPFAQAIMEALSYNSYEEEIKIEQKKEKETGTQIHTPDILTGFCFKCGKYCGVKSYMT